VGVVRARVRGEERVSVAKTSHGMVYCWNTYVAMTGRIIRPSHIAVNC
jgi:hypothetical protein